MVNNSEMVSNEKRVEIVGRYAEKLMNTEYLSLSMDTKNPKWKPLHMAAGWNTRNTRIAKQRSKAFW